MKQQLLEDGVIQARNIYILNRWSHYICDSHAYRIVANIPSWAMHVSAQMGINSMPFFPSEVTRWHSLQYNPYSV